MGVTRLKKAGEATITSTSKGPGTYPYMAPEMFKRARRGPPVDIYSLGCLYLELFGRRRVWPGLDGTEIMMKVCGSYDTPPCMPDLKHLDEMYFRICSSCCQLDPANRPNIDEIVNLVEQVWSLGILVCSASTPMKTWTWLICEPLFCVFQLPLLIQVHHE